MQKGKRGLSVLSLSEGGGKLLGCRKEEKGLGNARSQSRRLYQEGRGEGWSGGGESQARSVGGGEDQNEPNGKKYLDSIMTDRKESEAPL